MNVKLITITPDAEATMAYIARVSSPNQENPEYAKLLTYCLEHQHWSVFEHAYMTIEITTSRMISAQILRHRSFTFSEFSQRYSEPMDYVPVKARRQAEKNRQSSVDDAPVHVRSWWETIQQDVFADAQRAYEDAISYGVARECARAILPMNTQTRLYVTGSVRSWIHYIQLRTKADTQLEHREVAEGCKAIFVEQLPSVAAALGWA
ncbi:MAG: FAD-dependent thymidylate synthase [Betaproteobacteria bacterium]|nr:FAD-dependent thymidylate synthase [Betaproteobacteria bacterium]